MHQHRIKSWLRKVRGVGVFLFCLEPFIGTTPDIVLKLNGQLSSRHKLNPPIFRTVTSLMGLAPDADGRRTPLPGDEIELPLLTGLREFLKGIAPEIANALPQISEGFYAASISMDSYAVIRIEEGKPVLYLDHLVKPEGEREETQALSLLRGMLYAHEGMQYLLRDEKETMSGDLTEEVALFYEVDKLVWEKLKDEEREQIRALAEALDRREPNRGRRLSPTLRLVEKYSELDNSETSWLALAEELRAHAPRKFTGQEFSGVEFLKLRQRIKEIKQKEPQKAVDDIEAGIQQPTPPQHQQLQAELSLADLQNILEKIEEYANGFQQFDRRLRQWGGLPTWSDGRDFAGQIGMEEIRKFVSQDLQRLRGLGLKNIQMNQIKPGTICFKEKKKNGLVFILYIRESGEPKYVGWSWDDQEGLKWGDGWLDYLDVNAILTIEGIKDIKQLIENTKKTKGDVLIGTAL